MCFKPGQTVKSHYRAQLVGTILKIEKRPNNLGDLITVLVTHDKYSNKQRKPFVKQLDEGWLSSTKDTLDSIEYREACGL